MGKYRKAMQKAFDLEVDNSRLRRRAVEADAQITGLTTQRDAAEEALAEAEKERDDLRRQLSNIREAFGKLKTAVFPGDLPTGVIRPITLPEIDRSAPVGIMWNVWNAKAAAKAAAEMFPQCERGVERC